MPMLPHWMQLEDEGKELFYEQLHSVLEKVNNKLELGPKSKV